jgi:hypothetical protein
MWRFGDMHLLNAKPRNAALSAHMRKIIEENQLSSLPG